MQSSLHCLHLNMCLEFKGNNRIYTELLHLHSCNRDVRTLESATKAVEETVKKFGKLDILVNGAAGL